MVGNLEPREFLERRSAGVEMTLLDVREAWELQVAAAPTPIVHIPMDQVPNRLSELDPKNPVVVLCRSGGRSLNVANFLDAHGFASIYNLTGGILAWSRDLDPTIKQY